MKKRPSLDSLMKREVPESSAFSRRDFLRAQIAGMIWAAAGASGILMPRWGMAADVPDVVKAKGLPGPATRAAVNALGGMKTFVKEGSRVVIKPNMSFANTPESATNTHPEVVRELVAMCKEEGASRVLVLDHTLQSAELCLQQSGIRDACKVFNEDIVHTLSKSSFYESAKIEKGVDFKETDVMKDVLNADVLIAAPVAKSHANTGVSLSMKGMMGLIWDRGTMHRDYDLHSAIVDLCTLLTPQLVVVDATRVLTSNGPSGPGRIVRKNVVVASKDMVAADAQTVLLSEWYGRRFEPRQVKHIQIAHSRGLGRMDVENLTVKEIEA